MESLAIALNAGAAPAQDEDAPDPKRDVRRKLAAILNYPTIAKYLCMSFSVELPRREWNDALRPPGRKCRSGLRKFWLSRDGRWNRVDRRC